MKYVAAAFLLWFWMIATIVLIITIIGGAWLLVTMDEDENSWMDIPKKLLVVFEK